MLYEVITKTQHWTPLNFLPCFKCNDGDDIYNESNINNGYNRNYKMPNIWISEAGNDSETVIIRFDKTETISKLDLTFDSNLNMFYDNVEIYYDFNVMPQLVKDYKVYVKKNNDYVLLKEINNNHQRVNHLDFEPTTTDEIVITSYSIHYTKLYDFIYGGYYMFERIVNRHFLIPFVHNVYIFVLLFCIRQMSKQSSCDC